MASERIFRLLTSQQALSLRSVRQRFCDAWVNCFWFMLSLCATFDINRPLVTLSPVKKASIVFVVDLASFERLLLVVLKASVASSRVAWVISKVFSCSWDVQRPKSYSWSLVEGLLTSVATIAALLVGVPGNASLTLSSAPFLAFLFWYCSPFFWASLRAFLTCKTFSLLFS